MRIFICVFRSMINGLAPGTKENAPRGEQGACRGGRHPRRAGVAHNLLASLGGSCRRSRLMREKPGLPQTFGVCLIHRCAVPLPRRGRLWRCAEGAAPCRARPPGRAAVALGTSPEPSQIVGHRRHGQETVPYRAKDAMLPLKPKAANRDTRFFR